MSDGDNPPARFDDRARTVFATLGGDAGSRAAVWRQMIDLLCQPGRITTDRDTMIDAVATLATTMDEPTRIEAARTAAFGRPPAALVVLLGNDRPVVATAILPTVRLDDGEWREVLPQLSPVGRGILRSRRDLSAAIRAELESFGPTDYVLPAADRAGDAAIANPPAPPPLVAMPATGGLTRISDLVARIEAYRQGHRATPPVRADSEDDRGADRRDDTADALAAFRFETDAADVIRWVDVPDRAALIGLPLGGLAEGIGSGVDGTVWQAVRRRCAFADGRLRVASAGAAGGMWRLAATPAFERGSGRFMGYRGSADRLAHSLAEAAAEDATRLRADSLRQLIHEIRTPLNAIAGFAELLERQLVGPVPQAYRSQAEIVRADAVRLADGIEDLDVVARVERGALVPARHTIDLGDALARAVGRPVGRAIVLGDPGLIDRAVARLVALAGPDAVALGTGEGQAHVEAEALADGFDLDLLEGLARAAGGRLAAAGGALTLSLPLAPMAGEVSR